jgi:hypothetical protein
MRQAWRSCFSVANAEKKHAKLRGMFSFTRCAVTTDIAAHILNDIDNLLRHDFHGYFLSVTLL